jgi:hypothetical protein
MPRPFRSAPAFFLLAVLAPAGVQATERFVRIVSYVVSPLLSPRGARNLGMGSTGTASVNPVSTGYFNPATIAWTDGFLLAGEYQDQTYSAAEYLDPASSAFSDERTATDVRLSAGLLLSPEWRIGGLVGYQSVERFNPFAGLFGTPPDSGENDLMLTGLGAVSWTRGTVSIGLGATARHLSFHDVDLDGSDASGWAFDLGVLTAFTFRPGWGMVRPRVGFATTNMDTGWPSTGVHYEIVGEFRLAMGVDIASSTVTVAGRAVPIVSGSLDLDEFSRSDGDSWALSVGLELSILDLLQARIGHVDETGADTLYGFGLGWEVGGWMVRGDYARQSRSSWTLEQSDDTFGLAVGMHL